MITELYCDGGVFKENPSELGGSWAWCHVDENGNRIAQASGTVLPGELGMNTVSNNVTELIALTEALESVPDGWSGHVYSDSDITLGRAFRGYACEGLPAGLIQRLRRTIALKGTLKYTLLAGHPTREQLARGFKIKKNGAKYPVSRHNKWCDEACREQYEKFCVNVGLADQVLSILNDTAESTRQEQSEAYAQAWGAEEPSGRVFGGIIDG